MIHTPPSPRHPRAPYFGCWLNHGAVQYLFFPHDPAPPEFPLPAEIVWAEYVFAPARRRAVVVYQRATDLWITEAVHLAPEARYGFAGLWAPVRTDWPTLCARPAFSETTAGSQDWQQWCAIAGGRR